MRFCNECGSDVGSTDVFCSECGTKLKSKNNHDVDQNIDNDKSIKADLKIEVTNATTEKAFKKVGETVESGKKAVKTTTGIMKKLVVPGVILLIIAVVIGVLEKQKQNEASEAFRKAYNETMAIQEKNRLAEERNCVKQEYENTKKMFANMNIDIWSFVKTNCGLTYTEVEKYKKEFGLNSLIRN